MFARCFCVLLCGILASCNARHVYRRSDNRVWLEVSVMTWNILAPMWVDRHAVSKAAMIDTNLLNEKIRLWRIVQEIKNKKPDIVALQEVQEDIFLQLRDELSKHYDTTGLAPNENKYWERFLAEGATYQRNGVATFYNKNKFVAEESFLFPTGEGGSVGQISVFRPRHRRHRLSSRIITANCHLETGFTVHNVSTRVAQGSRVVNQVTTVATRYEQYDPTVLILGDMNSMSPHRGFHNIEERGYLDAQSNVGDPSNYTYFFEPPFVTPDGQRIHGGAIDHIFIRKADVEGNRARLKSVEIPLVTSREYSEESYVSDITKLLKKNFRHESVKGAGQMIPRLLKSDIFSSMYNAVHEGEKKEYQINRVLRRGSDHLHLSAQILIRQRDIAHHTGV